MNNNELSTALVKTQLEITAPKKDKYNAHLKYAYCSLDSIYDSIRVPLAKNGLFLSHTVETEVGGMVLVTAITHVSGGSISNKVPLILSKMDSQGLGMALTYSRKYAICSLLSLPSEDDTDGSETPGSSIPVPPKPTTLTKEQVKTILGLVGSDVPLLDSILVRYNVKNLFEIGGEHFGFIIHTLNSRKGK